MNRPMDAIPCRALVYASLIRSGEEPSWYRYTSIMLVGIIRGYDWCRVCTMHGCGMRISANQLCGCLLNGDLGGGDGIRSEAQSVLHMEYQSTAGERIGREMRMKTHSRGLDRSKWKGQQYQSTDAEQETIVLLHSLTDA